MGSMNEREIESESIRVARRWPGRLASASSVVCALVGAAHVRFEYGPMASLYDPRPVALIFGILALALGMARLLRGRSRVAVAATVVAALVVILSTRLMFFTYDEQDVRFHAADGTVLAGTLFSPPGGGRVPGVVFLHGSGPSTRQFFEWHAKLLARNGVAALAYDKRGAGESEGSTWEVGYEGYADDALSALELLADRPGVDNERLGVLGHSEGGWVAPLVARAHGQLAFVVVTSATHLSPAEQVVYETGAGVRAAGYREAVAERALGLQRRVMEYQRTGEGREALAAALQAVSAEPWFAVAELPERLFDPGEYEWWRSVMDFDPVSAWQGVRAPVLAVSGGRDPNSDVEASHEGLRAALDAGGNDRFTGVIFPRMEHGTVEWWLPGGMPPPRFPKGYPELLVRWIREQVSGPS